jgi:hypothetical protein
MRQYYPPAGRSTHSAGFNRFATSAPCTRRLNDWPTKRGGVVAELLDIQPVLDDLKSRSLQLLEARSRCLEVINQNFESGGDVAATVAGRLQRYRDADNDHDPELVQKAESVEQQVTAWLPVLIAVQGIVAAVSVDQFQTMARAAKGAFAAHQKTVEESRSDIERILVPFADRLANAQTPEARVEVFAALSDEELEELRRVTDMSERFNVELAKLQGIIEREIAAETEIAETFDAVRDFLEARQEVLKNYMRATDYFSGLEPKEQIGREASWEAAKQAAKIGIEFVATKAGPKVLQQIPAAGMVFAGGELVLEMRKRRKEFRRRAEELRRLATAREARGATDEVWTLGRNLTTDLTNLAELMALVEALGQWLDGLVESV